MSPRLSPAPLRKHRRKPRLLRALMWAPVAAAALMSVGCSITGVLATATRGGGGGGVIHGLSYGAGPRGGLDVYRPEHAGPAPVVVFIYGGSWQMGNRGMYAFVGKALSARGFLVVIPDYRVYPAVRYPDFLRDNAQAVRWARDNAARFGGDPKRLFLMGHSAGAYNVAMLTLDRRWLNEVGLTPRRDIRAAVGLAGPYDFLPLHDETLKIIFGPAQQRPQTQPIAYADGDAPPMLLAAGLKDKTVDPANATRLGDRIRSHGGEAEVRLYPGVTHTSIIGAIASPLRFVAPTLSDSIDFMRAHDDRPIAAAGPPAPVAPNGGRP